MTCNYLAIESSTDACSVALRFKNETRQRISLQARSHSELILPLINDLLAESETQLNQLDAIIFACGPGSFTGLRIAAGMVQGLAYGSQLPVVSVSSLALLAQTALHNYDLDRMITSIDARMGEVYWGVYRENKRKIMELVGDELVCTPDSIELNDLTIDCGVGSGGLYLKEFQSKYPQISNWNIDCVPEARYLLDLGEVEYQKGNLLDPEQAIPVYLREATNWKKLPGRKN